MLKRCLAVLTLLVMVSPAFPVGEIDGYETLDADACRSLVEQNRILPMADIVAITPVLANGQILDAVLLKKPPSLIYQIEVLGADGVVRTLYIDATDGKESPDANSERLDADSPR